MKHVRRGEAYKAAFQAKHRFWEDMDIYGGISWSNTKSCQLWYPTHGIHKAKGVVLGAYDFGGMYHTVMSQEDRIEAHLKDHEKIHPNFRELVEKTCNYWLASNESYAGMLGSMVTQVR